VNNPYTTADSGDEGLVWSGDYPTSPQQPQFGTTGMPAVPIRWVLIKDPKGSLNPSAPMHGLDGHASSNLAMVSLSLAGRSHLGSPCPSGVESQRQWSSRAMPLPALLALFSIVTLVAHQQLLQHPFECKSSLVSEDTTFADALALVEQQLWQMQTFQMSSADVDTVKVPRALSTLGLTYFAMLPNKPILNIN